MNHKGPNNESVKNYISVLKAHGVLFRRVLVKKEKACSSGNCQESSKIELGTAQLEFIWENNYQSVLSRKECKTGNLVYCVLQWKLKFFFLFCDFYCMFRRELIIVFNPMWFLRFFRVGAFCPMFVLINLFAVIADPVLSFRDAGHMRHASKSELQECTTCTPRREFLNQIF